MERKRLEEERQQKVSWKKWGPYWRDYVLFYEYFHG